ncbi:hypothetical protein KTH76_02225 [Acinetobacter baumannii]|uniref:hypothetical protein n=1 Tax=Acinetobacter baumannii TaxID=470 RepID=UPI00070EA0A8|nr:hypothetical protein [Acinetobacter baumannii]EKT8144759.1 hypothetical protein [Acinetobacter baumannii]EKU7085420.1 hypothetical protein [Acinetobacter baumannii]EKV1042085.1 hypothetical protein [Acinetobacter baumannii]EKV1046873.1 hypothetical protein [Acinetobacter baumannii]EKV1920636.1 hypothetical protein [Acinetobacter baumannii]
MQEILNFLENNHGILSIMITVFSAFALVLSLYVTRKQYLELRKAEKEYVDLLIKEKEFLKLLKDSEELDLQKTLASKYISKTNFDEKVFTNVFLKLDDSNRSLLQSAVFQKTDKNRKAYFEHLVDIAKKIVMTHS